MPPSSPVPSTSTPGEVMSSRVTFVPRSFVQVALPSAYTTPPACVFPDGFLLRFWTTCLFPWFYLRSFFTGIGARRRKEKLPAKYQLETVFSRAEFGNSYWHVFSSYFLVRVLFQYLALALLGVTPTFPQNSRNEQFNDMGKRNSSAPFKTKPRLEILRDKSSPSQNIPIPLFRICHAGEILSVKIKKNKEF